MKKLKQINHERWALPTYRAMRVSTPKWFQKVEGP